MPAIDMTALMAQISRVLEAPKSAITPVLIEAPKTIDVTAEPRKSDSKPMNIFVSHAVADRPLVTAFVNMLQLGIGVSREEIFYSSAKGMIPNGDFFVRHIITRLNAADLVIALLSRSYLTSHFCIAEAGAALARHAAGACDFFSVVIPPAAFSDLDAMLQGVQSGEITDGASLGELKDTITAKMTAKPYGSPAWDESRDAFLETAKATVSLYQAKAKLARIPVIGYIWQRQDGPDITAHSKLRIKLINETDGQITVQDGRWTPGVDGIPLLYRNPVIKWQLRQGTEEKEVLDVPSNSPFQTWVGFADNIDGAECLARAGTHRTGILHMKTRIDGHLIEHEIRF